MAEQTLTMTLRVDDQGTVVLDKFTKKLQDSSDQIKTGIGVIAADAFTNLASKAESASLAIFSFAESQAKAAREIEENSRVLGMNVSLYQQWTYVAGQAGASSDNLMNAMKFLSRSMMEAQTGSGKGSDALKTMGLSVTDAFGKVKSLDTLMTEIVSKFGQWADGPNKMALGMAVFGRGFLDIMPVLTKGTDEIKRLKDESESVGAIIGEKQVKALADAAKEWEKLAAVWKVLKAESAGLINTVLNPILNWAIELVKNLKAVPELFQNVWNVFVKGQGVPTEWGGGGLSAFGKPEKGKPEAPAIVSAAELERRQKLLTDIHKLQGGLMESTWTAEGGYKEFGYEPFEGLTKGIATIDGVKFSLKALEDQITATHKAEGEMTQHMVDSDWPTMDQMVKMVDKGNQYWLEHENNLKANAKEQLNLSKQYAELTGDVNGQINAMRQEAEQYAALQVATNKWSEDTAAAYLKVTNLQIEHMTTAYKYTQSLGTTIADSWSASMSKVITGQETFGDAMKKMWSGLAEYVIQQLLKMMAYQALFGNQSGTLVSGQGLVGSGYSWLSGLLSGGGASSMSTTGYGMYGLGGGGLGGFAAEGGIFNSPTPKIVGEAGPEAVVPLPGGKIPIEGGQGSPTVIQIIQTIEPENWIRKNSGTFIKMIASNVRSGGELKNVIRGA
jgi:hypothetical protein